MRAYQEMHMIGFAVEFQQLATPAGAYCGKDSFKLDKHGRSNHLPAVVRHKNQMIVQVKNAMAE